MQSKKSASFDIETNHKENKIITHVVFTENNNKFSMEINCMSEEYTKYLVDTLLSLKRIYQTDTDEKQNFKVTSKQNLKVLITGDISNALEILKNDGLIDEDTISDLFKDEAIKKIIEKNNEQYEKNEGDCKLFCVTALF